MWRSAAYSVPTSPGSRSSWRPPRGASRPREEIRGARTTEMRCSGPFIRAVGTICRHFAHHHRPITWTDQSIPGAGIEPARPCGQRLLRPPRLPFRHPGRVVQDSIIATPCADVESYTLPAESSGSGTSLADSIPTGVDHPRSSRKGLVGSESKVVPTDGFISLSRAEFGPGSEVESPRQTLPHLLTQVTCRTPQATPR